jgi:4-diphosphocytidyl-2C-methyl-D-erythritol kinase
VAAGLGGGSSDAAATLTAVAPMVGLSGTDLAEVASRIGADVPIFLVGGTVWMEGYGERITAETGLRGFAVGLVVPDFALATPDVYRRWDEMGGPTGPVFEGRPLPPSLRAHGVLRNDLTPAALSLAPGLGDLIADLGREWGAPVLMSGSGPTLFSCFPGLDEAEDAVRQMPGAVRSAHAAGLRSRGVALED